MKLLKDDEILTIVKLSIYAHYIPSIHIYIYANFVEGLVMTDIYLHDKIINLNN